MAPYVVHEYDPGRCTYALNEETKGLLKTSHFFKEKDEDLAKRRSHKYIKTPLSMQSYDAYLMEQHRQKFLKTKGGISHGT